MPDQKIGEIHVDVVADTGNLTADVKRAGEKAAKEAKINLGVNIAKLQQDLAEATRLISDARKRGDKEAEVKFRLQANDLRSQINAVKSELKGLDAAAESTGKSFFNLGGIARDAFKLIGGFFVVDRLTGSIRSAFDAAVSFESAFAGIKKTVNGTPEEFAKLSKEYRELAKTIPLSVEELAKIGETGGQLGVAKEGLIDFTKTIAAVAVSTDLTSEAAATDFARIANIFQKPASEVQRYASAVVALGNNGASTEREILGFSERIAASGKIAGLSEPEIFSIGAAFSNVGIEAEAGGTAVSKTLEAINQAVFKGGKDLAQFAQVAGVSAQDFAKMWKSSPVEAFNLFVRGLGTSGDLAKTILDELVDSDTRLSRAFLSAAQSGDLFTEAIRIGSEAYRENTALMNEAEQRYATAASQLQLIKSRWNDLGIIVGGVLVSAFIPVADFFTTIAESFSDATKKLTVFQKVVVSVGEAFLAYFSARLILPIVSGIQSLGSAIIAATGAMRTATITAAGLRSVLSAINPSVAITVAVFGIIEAINNFRALRAEMARARGVQDSQNEIATGLRKQLNAELEKSRNLSGDELKSSQKISTALSAQLELEASRADVARTYADLGSKQIWNMNARNQAFDAASAKEISATEYLKKATEGLSESEKGRLDTLRGIKTEITATANAVAGAPKIPSGFGDDGKSAKKEEEAIKKAEQAVEDYGKEIDDVAKRTEKLRDDTVKYYDDIASTIAKAKDKQDELRASLGTFKTDEAGKFVRSTAERDVKLAVDEKDARADLVKIEKDIAAATDDEARQQATERRVEAEKKLNDILRERQAIAAYGATDTAYAGEATRATTRAGMTEFERDKADYDERVKLKEQEVQDEIAKQQKIIDIQNRFAAIQTATDADTRRARIQLEQAAAGERKLTDEERQKLLADLGFGELTREEELEIMKQIARQRALEVERQELEAQQKALLDKKAEYFDLAEQLHKKSTDAMLTHTQTLIDAIQRAIEAQNRLNAARAASSFGGGQQLYTGGYATATGAAQMALYQQKVAIGRSLYALKRGFSTGGFTGGNSPSRPAGIVHEGEYIVPKGMVDAMPNVMSALESIRQRGNASIQNTTNRNVTITGGIHAHTPVEFNADRLMKDIAWRARFGM